MPVPPGSLAPTALIVLRWSPACRSRSGMSMPRGAFPERAASFWTRDAVGKPSIVWCARSIRLAPEELVARHLKGSLHRVKKPAGRATARSGQAHVDKGALSHQV